MLKEEEFVSALDFGEAVMASSTERQREEHSRWLQKPAVLTHLATLDQSFRIRRWSRACSWNPSQTTSRKPCRHGQGQTTREQAQEPNARSHALLGCPRGSIRG